MSTIKIYKTRNVQTPMRGTELSAGIDLFIPVDLTLQELSNVQPVKGMANVQYQSPSGIITEYILEPQRRILLPSGIKCKFPKGHCGLLVDKSGVSSKSGLTLLAKLIDEDYQGEIHINMVNTSDQPVKFYPGQKLTQMVVIPVNYCTVEECFSLEDLYKGEVTERGEGGFGSTNDKVASTIMPELKGEVVLPGEAPEIKKPKRKYVRKAKKA